MNDNITFRNNNYCTMNILIIFMHINLSILRVLFNILNHKRDMYAGTVPKGGEGGRSSSPGQILARSQECWRLMGYRCILWFMSLKRVNNHVLSWSMEIFFTYRTTENHVKRYGTIRNKLLTTTLVYILLIVGIPHCVSHK